MWCSAMARGLLSRTSLQPRSALVELPAKPFERSASAQAEPRRILPRQVC